MSLKKCTVYAPGTVANLVCGFDILGLCLSSPADEMEISLINEKKIIIKSANGYPLPENPEENTAGAPIIEMLKEIEEEVGFEIIIHKNIKPGSGLGSSAASAAGAVVGANHLLGNRFAKPDLLRFAMFGEKVASGVKHADNVAPCIYGGITLIRSISPLDVVPLNAPDLYISIVHPQIEVRTADARAVLRQSVQLKQAIKQWGNIAGLVAGICNNDYDLIGRSLEDVIIEPVRSQLIPGFADVKQKSKSVGALGGGISGSGPSIFMISETESIANDVAKEMKSVFDNLEIDNYTYVSKINKNGATIA